NTPAEAMQRFAHFAQQENRPIQIVFPMQEVIALVKQGMGELFRQVGLGLAGRVMEEEVEHLVGPRSERNAERQNWRWGIENGYCIVDGQRAPLPRPRVRSQAGREVRLGSYEMFQQ